MSEKESQNGFKNLKSALKKFVNKQRKRLSVLQEANFEKSEKYLTDMIGRDPENANNFPVPGVLIGILVWAFIILFPLILFINPDRSANLSVRQYMNYYLPMLATLMFFLANQRYLVPKLFFRRKYFLYIAANSLILTFVLWLREFISFLLDRAADVPISSFFLDYRLLGGTGHLSKGTVITFIIADLLVCFCCILIGIFSRQIVRAFILRERKRNTLEYELDFLKSQLSPHFLFNTLNNITSLISFDPKLAETSMTKLSQLLRVMLYRAGDKRISLRDDLDVLKKYAELERLRLDESFDLQFKTDVENMDLMMEPMLLMPLVENSMKHCVNPNGGGFSHVFIQQKGRSVYVKVENSNFPRNSKPNSGGLGLSTFRKRLELIYAGHYTYCARVEGETYIAELHLTLKDEEKDFLRMPIDKLKNIV